MKMQLSAASYSHLIKIFRFALEVETRRKEVAAIGYIVFPENISSGGRSIKVRNVYYNWKRAFDIATDLFMAFGGDTPKYVMFFAALKAINKFSKIHVIEIAPDHGLLIAILWQSRQDNSVHLQNCLGEIKDQFSTYFGYVPNGFQLSNMLSILDRMRIIELQRNGWILFREKILIKSESL